MSTPPQPGYGYPQQPYGQPPMPPQKQGMSTGKKIALGCGIPAVLGLILVGGCTALVGKAADDVSKELDKNFDSAQVGPSASAAGGKAGDGQPDITKDVQITKCSIETGDFGNKELKVTVETTNGGDKKYSYFAEGEILLNGVKKADIMSAGNNLAPGQKFVDDNAGALGYSIAQAAKSSDKVECKMSKVTRHAF